MWDTSAICAVAIPVKTYSFQCCHQNVSCAKNLSGTAISICWSVRLQPAVHPAAFCSVPSVVCFMYSLPYCRVIKLVMFLESAFQIIHIPVHTENGNVHLLCWGNRKGLPTHIGVAALGSWLSRFSEACRTIMASIFCHKNS